ncbi:hypothetical protein [Aureimonas populi]|uniref:Uncharacterized protein n=1 Tax=Aureimonas populi TaxID=1701758 RepID=A0ABW5CPJ0_9HYPH|nr:hypothetical protein [Aureimonas populi]
MKRVFSTVATAAWVGYHAAWTMGLAAQAAGAGTVDIWPGLALPNAASLGSPVACGLLLAAHGGVALGYSRAALTLQSSRSESLDHADRTVLLSLAGSAALAVAAHLFGFGGADAGAFSAGMALALLALLFDRLVEPLPEDDRDERAFAMAAVRIGAEMGRKRGQPDSLARRDG